MSCVAKFLMISNSLNLIIWIDVHELMVVDEWLVFRIAKI